MRNKKKIKRREVNYGTTVMNVAVSHGIWAVLAVFLLVYIVKSNEKRDEKQEETGKKLSVCNRETDREIRDFTSGTK